MNRASLLTEKRNDSTISENGNIWSAKVSRAAPSGQIGRGRGSRLRANTGHCPRARRMGQFDRGRVRRRGKNATDRATENFRDFSTSDRPQTSKTDQDPRPIPTLQDGPYERAGSARERTLAEDVGWARGLAVGLRVVRRAVAYLLGVPW